MKKLILALMAISLLAGCAAAFEEAYYVDREWGQAQMDAWDRQVAYPNYKYAGKTPEGMEGITAEEVMGVYNQSFAERAEKTEVFELGVTSESGK